MTTVMVCRFNKYPGRIWETRIALSFYVANPYVVVVIH